MTTCEQIETSLTRSLSNLVEDWPDMLEPPYRSGPAKAATGNPTLADDQADTDADTDWMHRVVSLRREITEGLNGWARVVMEDRDITATLPPGNDAEALAAFLLVHAQWFSGHEAAEDAADELRRWAHKARMVVAPSRKDWLTLGDCPFIVDGAFCHGRVRGYPDTDRLPACTGCGQYGPTEWWEEVLTPDTLRVLTHEQLVPFIRRQFGRTVSRVTIRVWVHRGVLAVADVDEQGRSLFDRDAVVWSLTRKWAA